MIGIKNLTGGYGNKPVIQNVNFSLEKGEFFGLLGPNGSGKTTLFKLITGALPAAGGEITVEGKPLSGFSKLEKARMIAVLTQEAHVSFDFTVEEIVSLGRYAFQKGLFKSLSRQDRKVIDDVMELTGVTKYRDTQFRLISGGEKQRVLLAKALAQEPKIMLLDEPTNHLDVKHSFHMLDLLKEWQREYGLTVFAILHDLNVAALYADRVALLHEGSFLKTGGVDILRDESLLRQVYEVDVKSQPHPYVPKPQLLMTPEDKEGPPKDHFSRSYRVRQNEGLIHIEFNEPLRTISNGVTGEGIQWLNHFCNFHVNNNYDGGEPVDDMTNWMKNQGIPPEKAAGMMTAVKLEDMVLLEKEYEEIRLLAMVTAGAGNAVDITSEELDSEIGKIGTINIMVFLDSHFTDGALVNACLSATEAKTKALQDLNIKDPYTGTIATGTSTDSLLIGTTQKGERTPYAGSGTIAGKAIGTAVYDAVTGAVRKYEKRQRRS
ncbi:adenosylcobinamide amidohydrolase [Salipaludibacillus sp. CUR1]|uniref:adenosylcobinamide amidohydrolase n=1 Tax=Salipaludibacillus sp. CUR1 TaxID=2820003 RepID=UPI001E608C8E|nr:adenosylcobinamide amidohydrolase [Salipaludibacillus sp. CUR1]MCE7791606.1 adenosylcobinamide amidohydrolase [Salipaludibacillus sp. CUR1]